MNILKQNTYTLGLWMSGRHKLYAILYDIMGNHEGNCEHPISITMSMKQYLNSYKNILRFFGKLNHEKFGYGFFFFFFCSFSNPVVHNLSFFRDNRPFCAPACCCWYGSGCLITHCITPHGQMALVVACYRFMAGFPIWAQASVSGCLKHAHMRPMMASNLNHKKMPAYLVLFLLNCTWMDANNLKLTFW